MRDECHETLFLCFYLSLYVLCRCARYQRHMRNVIWAISINKAVIYQDENERNVIVIGEVRVSERERE